MTTRKGSWDSVRGLTTVRKDYFNLAWDAVDGKVLRGLAELRGQPISHVVLQLVRDAFDVELRALLGTSLPVVPDEHVFEHSALVEGVVYPRGHIHRKSFSEMLRQANMIRPRGPLV